MAGTFAIVISLGFNLVCLLYCNHFTSIGNGFNIVIYRAEEQAGTAAAAVTAAAVAVAAAAVAAVAGEVAVPVV